MRNVCLNYRVGRGGGVEWGVLKRDAWLQFNFSHLIRAEATEMACALCLGHFSVYPLSSAFLNLTVNIYIIMLLILASALSETRMKLLLSTMSSHEVSLTTFQ